LAGEWYYEEFSRGAGVRSLGLEDRPAPSANDPDPNAPAPEEEKKSILDLFKG
jgi:penicillin-binding protein 1A